MSTLPIENLELRALEQRRQLHERAAELKTKMQVAREKLDIEQNAREHFGAAAAIVVAFGLLSGYAFGGIFTAR